MALSLLFKLLVLLLFINVPSNICQTLYLDNVTAIMLRLPFLSLSVKQLVVQGLYSPCVCNAWLAGCSGRQ